MIGDGSDVLGYDDTVWPDHDFGPRVQIVLPPDVAPAPVVAALATLPERQHGLPVWFTSETAFNGWTTTPAVTTAAALFTARLGFDPAAGVPLADWLLTPTQLLATVTAAPVFHDPAGLLTAGREAVTWYPEDVWRYVLAAGWLRVDQEAPFVGRTGGYGDELGSAILAARLVRDLIRLALLVARQWAPYSKWLGTAFARLPVAAVLAPELSAALAASHWREREQALGRAAGHLVAATNALGLAARVDPFPVAFHERDIRVPPAAGLVTALVAAITDPALRRLIERVGDRSDSTPRLPGGIDQAVDSVDVLTSPARRRVAGSMLGLPG